MRPQDGDYPAFFRGYVGLVTESDALAVLESQVEMFGQLGSVVPPAKETFAYAPGKWTVREIAGHLGDGERVFGFRAYSFGRGERAELPSFDEKAYVANSRFRETPLGDLLDELTLLRRANLRMLRGLGDAPWANVGTVNGSRISVRALAFIMAGHVRHHFVVLKDRYGLSVGS